MKAALRVLVLTGSVIKIAAQTVTLNALAEVPNQYDDIPLTWTSTDIDATAQFKFYRCATAPGASCSGCNTPSSPIASLNDGMTTLINTGSSPSDWTVYQGSMYICMALSSDPSVYSATPEIIIPTPTLTANSVGPSNLAQYDDVTFKWSSTGLGEKADITQYRCKELPAVATDDCTLNTKCQQIGSIENSGFDRISTDYTNTYYSHVDDAYPYSPGWTTDAGTFYVCSYLAQRDNTGAAADPIFQYSSAYKVSAPSLNLEKPNSESCYDPFETVSVKWGTKGGGEEVDLYKCKSRPSSNAMVTCSVHPDCNSLSPANTQVANSGFAYVASTAKGDLTGAAGTYFLCASSSQAESELYSYSGEYTISDDENACPLSGPEIAGVTIACVVVFACLLGACFCAWKRFGGGDGGGGGSGTTTTKEPPVVLANVYE